MERINSSVLQHGNQSQVFPPAPEWLPLTSHTNGSMLASPPPLTERPVQKRSGILPALLAAGIFIAFLLALYTVLWKCMVSPPKRGKKRRVRKADRASV